MEEILTLFWNRQESRLRSFWRLVGQILLLLAFMLPLQTCIGIAGLTMLMAQEGLTLDQLSDPRILEGFLTAQALQDFFTQTPSLFLSYTATSLIALLISIWLAGRFLDRRRFVVFGFHINRNWWIDLGFGLFLGAFLMLLVFLVQLSAGWLNITGTFVTHTPQTPFFLAILVPFAAFLAVGFYEELFSRGYQLQNLAEGLNWASLGPQMAILLATVISSAIFGLLHIINPNATLISTFNIFIAGFFLLATGYILTGELAIPIGVHITWNFFQGNVFGFHVSGIAPISATFIGIEQLGPDIWTGGAFGPEAGLLGLSAMVVGALLTALWVRWRYGRLELHRRLAQPPEPPNLSKQLNS